MFKKNNQQEIDQLILRYIKYLENDEQQKKKLLTSADALKLLHATGKYPYEKSMDEKDYEKTMEKLQLELVKVQYWLQRSGQKIVAVFEGRDAAGKGGTVKRFMMNLNPRYVNHVALAKPSENEQSQWYFQRYVSHLPVAGEMSFFDRSWYNRAGVERVMGYCSNEQYQQFIKGVVPLEKEWTESGIILIKYWLSVNQLEQLRRFRKRQISELRRWKLSPNDIETVGKWDDYTVAIDDLFNQTSHQAAPWYKVKTDDKMRGRIECIKHFLSQLDYPQKNEKIIQPIDDKIIEKQKTVD
ncbi:MAG: polyphosphate kinase 2 [Ostreibacterium sp.]